MTFPLFYHANNFAIDIENTILPSSVQAGLTALAIARTKGPWHSTIVDFLTAKGAAEVQTSHFSTTMLTIFTLSFSQSLYPQFASLIYFPTKLQSRHRVLAASKYCPLLLLKPLAAIIQRRSRGAMQRTLKLSASSATMRSTVFLFPHSLTCIYFCNHRNVSQQNQSLLEVFTVIYQHGPF
jgi:hypothetical protein